MRWLALLGDEATPPVSGGSRDIFAWVGIIGSCLVALSALATLIQRVPWLSWPFRKVGAGIRKVYRWVRTPTANTAQIAVLTGRMDAMAAENARGFETIRVEVLAGQDKIRDDLTDRLDRQTAELKSHTELEERRFERIADVIAAAGVARRPEIVEAMRRRDDPTDAWPERAAIPPAEG